MECSKLDSILALDGTLRGPQTGVRLSGAGACKLFFVECNCVDIGPMFSMFSNQWLSSEPQRELRGYDTEKIIRGANIEQATPNRKSVQSLGRTATVVVGSTPGNGTDPFKHYCHKKVRRRA